MPVLTGNSSAMTRTPPGYDQPGRVILKILQELLEVFI